MSGVNLSKLVLGMQALLHGIKTLTPHQSIHSHEVLFKSTLLLGQFSDLLLPKKLLGLSGTLIQITGKLNLLFS
jgi:hypothetical protein